MKDGKIAAIPTGFSIWHVPSVRLIASGFTMDAPKRILIVDDEPNVRLVFRTALEATGYLVTEAADGDAALAQLRELPTDLICLT